MSTLEERIGGMLEEARRQQEGSTTAVRQPQSQTGNSLADRIGGMLEDARAWQTQHPEVLEEQRKQKEEAQRKQQEEKRESLLQEYKKLRGNSIPVTQKRNQLRAQLQELNRQMGLEEQDFSFSDRSASVFTGSTKQFGSGFLNFLGTGLDALRQLGQRLGGNTSPYAGYATDELSAAQIGTEQDPSYYDDAARMTERLQSAADRLNESGAEDLTRAKGGLGQLGQLGVDVASNALQMGYDAALGALSGGGSLASMFVRSAGGGMQSARQEGASTGQQLAFGAVSGGIEVLTEKMFDGVARIYGAGAADEIVEKAIGKLSKSSFGRSAMRWLTGAAGEGFEEVVSDLLAPYAETVYNGKSVAETAKGTFSGTYDPSDILYDFIIGAALGGLGGIANVATGQDAAANARLRTADTAREELLTRGFDKKTAQEMAGIIAKERSGEQLTQAEQTRLNRFPTAQEVLRQVTEQQNAARQEAANTRQQAAKLDPFTEHEAGNLLSSTKNKVVGFGSTIRDFVKEAIASKGQGGRLYAGKIPPKVSEMVLDATGLDVYGFSSIVNSSEVWHAFRNHSDPNTEERRGQVALTEEDFDLIPQILADPDRVELAPRLDGLGRKAIFFTKSFGNEYVTVQGYSDGKKALLFDSMWIKKDASRHVPLPENDPARDTRPKRGDGTASISSIAEGGGDVNSDIQSSIQSAFEGAGIGLHQAELTALANGYAAGETDADDYTQGALAAYQLGKSGQFTLDEAVRGSSWSKVLSESQFRNAFNLGAALRGNQTAAESSEDREQLKASLAKLGDYAGTAEEAYEPGQDASTYAAAMDKAASLYAANGADLRAVVQEARAGTRQDIVGTLTDRQVETAIQIGEQMRQQNRETARQLNASYKQIREQAAALRGGQETSLKKINASIREANDTGKRALEAFNGQLAALERMAQAEPGTQESEEYDRLYDEALKNKETALEMQKAIRELSEQKKELESRKPEGRKGTLRLAEKAGELGGVPYEAVDMGGLNEQQRAAVEAAEMIAQVTGLDITLISAKGNLGGAYLGGGQIYLNIRSGMGLRSFSKAIAAGSLAHEMTHWMKEYAPEEYAALREHTIGSMSAGQLDSLVQEQLRAEPGLSYDRAVDEVVANACQPLLRDSEAIERLARENMTLAERIVEFIRQFTEKIKAAFQQVDFHDNLPIYRAAQAVEQELDSMGRLWDRALTAARENMEAQTVRNNAQENEKSARSQEESARSQEESARSQSAEFQLIGKNEDGEEVYETSEQLKGLSYAEKLEQFKANFYTPGTPQYLGKRIRFRTKNGTYLAEIDRQTQRENVKKINPGTLHPSDKAKINVGAAGDFITLLENARLDKENVPLRKQNNEAKKGVTHFDYFLKDVEIDGRRFRVIINIRATESGKFVYEVSLKPNKKGPQVRPSGGKTPPSTTEANASKWSPKSVELTPAGELPAKQALIAEPISSTSGTTVAQGAEKVKGQLQTWTEEEAEDFRKKAVSEFGYTPYFYDAGYILPNGKMLNFSGEKGKHFGTRGEDHLAIGAVFPEGVSNGEAVVGFLGQGNIRIMPEAPGLDISAAAEPTKEQYATITRFANESRERGSFSVDFTNERGRTVGSLEYQGAVRASRVREDIRHYFQTGELRQQPETEKFRYSFQTWEDGETSGLKEQLRQNQDKLNKMETVAKIDTMMYAGLESKEAKRRILAEMKKTSYKVDRQGFGTIQFGEAEINRSIDYTEKTREAEDARRTAFLLLPKVLKRGIEISGHNNHKGRGYDTATFAAPVEINGKPGNMVVAVKRTKGNRYKVHRVLTPDGRTLTLEKANALEQTAGAFTDVSQSSGGSDPAISNASTPSIRGEAEDVKGEFQRWDDTEDDTAAEKQGRELAYARLRSENALLKETVKALNKTVAKKEGTIGKLQSRLQLTKTPEVRQGDARRLARELLRQNSSRADAESVAGKIKAVGDYILQTEKVDEATLKAKARRAAVEILDAAYENINIDSEIYGQIAGEIRGKKLSIDEDFLGELDSEGGYDKFRKSLFGSVTLSRRGSHTLESREGVSSVDRFYTDMQGSFGKAYFPDVSNEGEQIKVLSELLKAGSPIEVNPFEKYMGEATEDLANRIAMEAMSGVLRPTAPTTADRQRARTQALRDQILELKKESKLEQREAARLYQTVYELSLALDKAESRYTSLGQETRYREAQVRAEGRERAAQIKAAERERAARQISALKFHYQEMERRARKNREENAGIRKYREQVEKKAKSLYELLTKNTNDKHVPQSLKLPLAQFLETLDFSGERLLSGGEATQKDLEMGARLQKLQQMLANQQRAINGEDAAPDDLGGYIDVSPGVLDYLREMSEKITEAMNTGRSFTINLMSAEDLKKLSILLSNLGAAIRNMNKFMANARYASVQEAASDDIADMEELGKVSALGNSGVSKFTMWENGVPYYVFKRFGKGGESIFEGFTKGWERMAFNAKEIIDFTEKTYTAKEVRAWKKEGHDFTLSDGSKIHMTTGQIMELSQLLGREQAVQHMEKGGVRIGSIRTKKGELADPTHYHLSQEDLAQIVGTLTDRQFEVARQMQRFMARKGADWGNEVSMRRFGYNFYEEGPGYYPIRTDSNDRPMADTDAQQNSMFRLLNLSSSKAVNPRATNALIVGDIFDTFADHMSDMAKLNGMGLPILDAIKWFSYKERVDRPDGTYDTRTVQGAMERAYGGQALRYFRTLMKDINGQTETGDRGTGLSGWFLSHYKAAAVGANLRVAALQPTSYVRALTVLKPQHLAKGLLRNNYEEAMKWSGTAVWKSLGYYDTDISKSMRGQIQHADSWREKAVEFSMILAEKGDSLTWGRLWTACRSQAKAENRNLSGEALMEATAGLFREVIYSSQVMDATLTRSEVMRAKGGLSKLRSAFMAEPTLSYNILMDSVNEFFRETRRSGSKAKAWQKINKKFARATMTYLSSAALAAVVESLADAIRDDDDDKFLNKWLEAFWGETWYDGNFKQDLTILGKLPEVKDIQALLTGSDSGNMSWSAIRGAVEVYQMVVETVKLEKGEIDRATKVTSYGRITPWGMIYKGLQAFSQLTALPFANMSRDVLALYNTVMGAMGYDDKKVRRYDAGDESRIQDAFEAGRLTEEEAIARLIEKGEADDEEDAYWTVRGWATGYGKYDGLKEAALSGDSGAYKSAMEELTGHGVKEKEALSEMKKFLKKAYTGGELSKAEASILGEQSLDAAKAQQILTGLAGMKQEEAKELTAAWAFQKEHGFSYEDGKKEAYLEGSVSRQEMKGYLTGYGGMSAEDAEEQLDAWDFEEEHGYAYGSRKEAFLSGQISRQEAINVMTGYGGMSREDAELQVQVWEWSNTVPGAEKISPEAVQLYNSKLSGSGVSKETYVQIWKQKNATKADLDENGESIRNSVTAKVIPMIDALPISAEQKTAIALCWWAESTVNKYKLW